MGDDGRNKHDVTFREAGVDIEKKRFSSALTPADQRFDLLKTLSSTNNYWMTVEFIEN